MLWRWRLRRSERVVCARIRAAFSRIAPISGITMPTAIRRWPHSRGSSNGAAERAMLMSANATSTNAEPSQSSRHSGHRPGRSRRTATSRNPIASASTIGCTPPIRPRPRSHHADTATIAGRASIRTAWSARRERVPSWNAQAARPRVSAWVRDHAQVSMACRVAGETRTVSRASRSAKYATIGRKRLRTRRSTGSASDLQRVLENHAARAAR